MSTGQFKVGYKTLEVQQFTQELFLSQTDIMFGTIDVHATLGMFTNDFIVSVRARMPGEVVEKHTYPTTWLDALLDRFVPKRLKKLIPISYTTIQTWHCYPEVPVHPKAIQYLEKGVMTIGGEEK